MDILIYLIPLQMNAMYEYLNAKRKAMAMQAKLLEAGMNIQPKYEYDSDEDVDGGTWEHKRRDAEMDATKGLFYPINFTHPTKFLQGGGGGGVNIRKNV